MDVTTLDGKARLPCIDESAPYSCARSNVNVSIVENNHRILATQFEHYRQQSFGRYRRDSPAGRDTSGKNKLVNVALHQRRSGSAFTRQDLKNVFGNARRA